MMQQIKYSIEAPDIVKAVADAFKKRLKEKTKLVLKMKNAEKKKKPSDIVLVFFPIVSRTGTDIDAAMKNMESLGSKPVILVVLHHTFDPETVVSESRKFVDRKNTFTVDCLFYEDNGLLECKRNNKAVKEAAEWLKSKKDELKQIKKENKGKQKGSSTES